MRKRAKENIYPTTIYWQDSYNPKTDVFLYGNFTTPPWKVLSLFSLGSS